MDTDNTVYEVFYVESIYDPGETYDVGPAYDSHIKALEAIKSTPLYSDMRLRFRIRKEYVLCAPGVTP